jgi:hypothetical protein
MIEINKQLSEINTKQFELKDLKELLTLFSNSKGPKKADFFKLDNNNSKLSNSEKKLYNLYKKL